MKGCTTMKTQTTPTTVRAFDLLTCCAFVLTMAGWASAQPLVRQPAEPTSQAGHELQRARVAFAQRQALAAYGPEIAVTFGDAEVPTLLTGQLSRRIRPDDAVAEAQAAL